MVAAYSIAYGREPEHAAELKAGLETMVDGFAACLCGWCGGEGRSEQRFTAGCGGGYYNAMSGCDPCDGTGLVLAGDQGPAPASIREQVLTAGREALGRDERALA